MALHRVPTFEDLPLSDGRTLDPSDKIEVRKLKSYGVFVKYIEDRAPWSTNFSRRLEVIYPSIRSLLSIDESLFTLLHFDNANPTVWGLLGLLLTFIARREDRLRDKHDYEDVQQGSFDNFATMFSEISEQLKVLIAWRKVNVSSEDQADTAQKVHQWLVKFLFVAIVYYRDFRMPESYYAGARPNLNSPGISDWKRLEENYNELLRQLGDLSKRLNRILQIEGHHRSNPLARSPTESLTISSEVVGSEVVRSKPLLRYTNMQQQSSEYFTGRDELLKEMDKALNPSLDDSVDPPLDLRMPKVALFGLPGVGKTQAALQYAIRRYRERRYDIVLWVRSQHLGTLLQDYGKAAVELEVPDCTTAPDEVRRALLVQWLRETESRWLIVFDNVLEASMIKKSIPVLGNGSIIVTTQNEALGRRLTADQFEVTALSIADSVALLLRLTGQSARRDPGESMAAERLSKLLGGYALAICQMAGLIRRRRLSLKNFLSMYVRNRGMWHGMHDDSYIAEYKFFIDSIWTYSFKLLGKRQSTMLSILSMLVPDSVPELLFSLPKRMAQGTDLDFCINSNDCAEVEEPLLDLGLVGKDVEEGNLSVHRLVQVEYLSHISAEARQQAFEHAATLLHQAFPHQNKDQFMHSASAWKLCEQYIQQVLSLTRHYRDPHDERLAKLRPTSDFLKLLCNACWYLFERESVELPALIDVALGACTPESYDPLVYAHLLNTKANMLEWSGDFREARRHWQDCLKIRKENCQKNDLELAVVYSNLSLSACSLYEFSLANELAQEGFNISSQHELSRHTIHILIMLNLGRAQWYSGNRIQGRETVREALRLGSTERLVTCHCYLFYGTMCLEQRQLSEARDNYNKAREIMSDPLHNPMHNTVAAIWHKLGLLDFEEKQYDSAIHNFKAGYNTAKACNMRVDAARSAFMLAKTLRTQGRGDSEDCQNYAREAQLAEPAMESLRLQDIITIDSTDSVYAPRVSINRR